MNQVKVVPAEGRLGILVVGCGAVATTLMTGVLMARKGLAKPIGSMTQFDRIRVGSGEVRQARTRQQTRRDHITLEAVTGHLQTHLILIADDGVR